MLAYGAILPNAISEWGHLLAFIFAALFAFTLAFYTYNYKRFGHFITGS